MCSVTILTKLNTVLSTIVNSDHYIYFNYQVVYTNGTLLIFKYWDAYFNGYIADIDI